jgi:membrane protein
MGKSVARTANKVVVPGTRGEIGLADMASALRVELRNDHVSSYAKSLAFSALIAIFPMVLVVTYALGLVQSEESLIDLVSRARDGLPDEAYDLLVRQIIPSIATNVDKGLTIGALVAVAVSVWGVSGMVRDLMNALDVIYNVEDRRRAVVRYAISIGLGIAVALLLATAAVLAVAGNSIAKRLTDAVGFGEVFHYSWLVFQWPLLAVFVVAAFTLVYRYGPDIDQSFRFTVIGAGVAFVLWLIFTGLFAVYVNTFGSYSKTYGVLAGVIVMLLYLYYSTFILLIGAEANQIVASARYGKH